MRNYRILIGLIVFSLIVLGGCNRVNEATHTISIEEILQLDFPNHYPENTVDAFILREIIKKYVESGDSSNFISYIKERLLKDLYVKDSNLCNNISLKIETDSSLVNDCIYLKNALSCNEQYISKHFIVYNMNSSVDTQQVNLYDKQFEVLQSVFNETGAERINLVLDTNLNYWRAFPIWNVKYGLLQRYINGNPHELVHHFFTKYSDVPFFHEPMAFLYGDYGNDTTKFYTDFCKNSEQLSNEDYVLAKNVWHFPAIVLLKRNDKLSFWLFTSTLMQRYGIDKFIQFASITTWDKNNEEFENNFESIYNVSLEEFEKKHVISNLK